MFISENFHLCPTRLVSRSFSSDVSSTADSFKSWDTCMDNKTCKIVAIVGIVLACILAIWFLTSVFRCLCMGVDCLTSMCCCCCRPATSNNYQQPPDVYHNPNMYAPTPAPNYTRQPQQAYFTGNQGYKPMDDEYNDENPFSEKNTSYRGY